MQEPSGLTTGRLFSANQQVNNLELRWYLVAESILGRAKTQQL
jgi:hypothetical protein